MTTAFLGDWLVSEYVYTPAGEFVGVVRQRRRLQPLAAGTIRVAQLCEPVATAATLSAQAAATAAIMNRRVGEFVFDLQLAGQARHYLGPDVLGGGFSWREGALTARGHWPRFGYNFTSFSILLNPQRQATGGRFFIANREIAAIVGTAVPEEQGYPETVEPAAPPRADYRGWRETISPMGELLERVALDNYACIAREIDAAPGREQRYGPLREAEAVTGPGATLSLIELHDPAVHTVVGLGRRFRDERLQQVEWYRLCADEPAHTADGRHRSTP